MREKERQTTTNSSCKIVYKAIDYAALLLQSRQQVCFIYGLILS
jgi:hypothetical protein